MKKLLAIALALAAAAVLGFQTTSLGRASPSSTQYGEVSYCIDNQTVTTADTGLQSFLNGSIENAGGALTSAEIVYEGTDPDAAGEASETVIDQYYGDDDVVFPLAVLQFYVDAYVWVHYGADAGDITAHHVAADACPAAPVAAPEPTRVAYCSVAGNTWPGGAPIAPGTFLNLLAGQPATDQHYTGAVPAWYVEGVGLTCALTPAQAALAAASPLRAGGAGDLETPIPGVADYAIYTYVPAK
jgi:hypothetical protein